MRHPEGQDDSVEVQFHHAEASRDWGTQTSLRPGL